MEETTEITRLLIVLMKDHGMNDNHFRSIHHFGQGTSIGAMKAYCEKTRFFRRVSNNRTVLFRLRKIRDVLSSYEGHTTAAGWAEAIREARRLQFPNPTRLGH